MYEDFALKVELLIANKRDGVTSLLLDAVFTILKAVTPYSIYSTVLIIIIYLNGTSP